MNISDLTITSLDVINAYDVVTGAWLYRLDELQSATISQGQETVDITGKQGRKLATLKRNKTATISGANGLVSGGMLESQTGCKFENKITKVRWDDYLVVTGGTATTNYRAVGNVGSEIISIDIRNSDGTAGVVLEQDATPSDGKFAYDPATKEITFSGIADGTEVIAHYDRNIQASVLENYSDTYSGKAALYVDATAEDKCANVFHLQFYFPKADFNGEFSIEMGGDQVVHNFEAEALTNGYCSASTAAEGILWTYTIFGATQGDAEDDTTAENPEDTTKATTDKLTIPGQTESLLGKNVSELIGTDVQVYEDGSVVGTLKNVTDFTEFNKADPAEQSGHYFPFHLTQTGTKMTLKKNGVAKAGKQNMDFDADIIFRVDDANTTFTVEVDSTEVITLSFKGATFA